MMNENELVARDVIVYNVIPFPYSQKNNNYLTVLINITGQIHQ